MIVGKSLVGTLAVLLIASAIYTFSQTSKIEQRFRPSGQFAQLGNTKLHYVDKDANSGKTPVLFIHGASGNLHDQQGAFETKLNGHVRMIFLDRPGYGYSERVDADTPLKQAHLYKKLLDYLEIEEVVVVGHSLGGASVATFAVEYPETVKGMLLLSPATHPWAGGVAWYYKIASMPVVGWLFSHTVVTPLGQIGRDGGVTSVFDPQTPPPGYAENTALPLIFRPNSFRSNAIDVAGLNAFVQGFSHRYREIKKPVVIISGDADEIVTTSIHSIALENEIEGAELIVLPGVGHKPDYVASDLAAQKIIELAK